MSAAVEVDAMNGNLVLVPRPTAERMGGIDGKFSHALADIDYATRARRLGHRLCLLPERLELAHATSLRKTRVSGLDGDDSRESRAGDIRVQLHESFAVWRRERGRYGGLQHTCFGGLEPSCDSPYSKVCADEDRFPTA